MIGDWKWENPITGILSLELFDENLPRHQFKAKIKISSQRKAQFNKMQWIEYYSEQIADPLNTKSFVSKSHLKTFSFSKVKSWVGYI